MTTTTTPNLHQPDDTKTYLVGIRGDRRWSLDYCILMHLNFKTSGSMTGERHPWNHGSGYLRGADLDQWRADTKAQTLEYVIRSYATPIAWVTKDGRVHRVAQKFSVTTSKHAGFTYMLTRESPESVAEYGHWLESDYVRNGIIREGVIKFL